MSETKKIDGTNVTFSSTACPSEEDMALWNSLSAEQQRALVRRDLDEAEASGVAEPETADQVIRRVRARTDRGE